LSEIKSLLHIRKKRFDENKQRPSNGKRKIFGNEDFSKFLDHALLGAFNFVANKI